MLQVMFKQEAVCGACYGQLLPNKIAITEMSSLLRRFCACSRSASATACALRPEA